MSQSLDKSAAFAALPPPWAEDPLPAIRAAVAHSPRKVVVLDDDPTGTQTVRDLTVVTRWDVATLRAELGDPAPGFFVLTNSRSLDDAATRELHHEIATNLAAAADGHPFTVISRSDSTLRGHFPAETDALAAVLGPADLVIVAPYFEAGGRYTIGDEHYVEENGRLLPAAETPFARDTVFGYRSSHLPAWVEEKTNGRIPAENVASVSLDLIRSGGPTAVEEHLLSLPTGSVCIVNAATPRDIEVFAAAALRVEDSRSVIYRSAASLAAARLGQAPQPPLEPDQLTGRASTNAGGLVVVGSHVPKTTAQLAHLRHHHDIEAVELDVATILDSGTRQQFLSDKSADLNQALASGRNVVLFTSRKLVSGADSHDDLDIARKVSTALVELVRALALQPRFLIAKGGITSSDIATEALEVRRARVIGQILPGVPVWQLGPESRFPGLPYVIFPGNVGSDDALSAAVAALCERR